MIPEAAVEAAAVAAYSGDWITLHSAAQNVRRAIARTHIEAAAPHMLCKPGLDNGIHESRTVDPMVEAVAKALHAFDCGWNDWDDIHTRGGSYVVRARKALEATAAHLTRTTK